MAATKKLTHTAAEVDAAIDKTGTNATNIEAINKRIPYATAMMTSTVSFRDAAGAPTATKGAFAALDMLNDDIANLTKNAVTNKVYLANSYYAVTVYKYTDDFYGGLLYGYDVVVLSFQHTPSNFSVRQL